MQILPVIAGSQCGGQWPEVGHGPAAIKRNVTASRKAFPDLVWTIEEVIEEAGQV